jgi:hypothetical protein
MCNIFNKIIAEKFTNLKKEMPMQVLEAFRMLKIHGKNRTSP